MERTLIHFLALVLALSLLLGMGTVPAQADEINEITFIEGTEGAQSWENADSALDGNADTKWCVTDFDAAILLWSLENPVVPESYVMVTANDCATYPDRNPLAWAVMAANTDEIPVDINQWDILTLVEGDERMQNVNGEAYRYEIEDTEKAYRHYMLLVLETKGSTTMQLADCFLEYDGCEYTADSGSETEEDTEVTATGNFSSTYITDGGEYTMAVGDSLSMYHPRTPTSPYYAYTWIVESGEDCVVLDRGQGTCNVIAVKPGTVKLMANLDYTVLSGYWSESYSYEYEVTIHIEESGEYDHGDVTEGRCPRCFGTGKVDCTACYGDGEYVTGKACTGCIGGKVDCNHCHGTGRWNS